MNEIGKNGFRWWVLVTMFLVTATAAIFMIAPAPLLGTMMRTASGLSPRQVTFMTMGIFNLFLFVAMILGGPLLDKFGFSNVYIFGLILMGIGALLAPSIGHSFQGMIFVRILQAIGAGPIMVSAIPIAAKYFPVKLRTVIIVVQGFAVSAGVPLGLAVISRISQAAESPQTALAWLAPFIIPGLVLSSITALRKKQSEMEAGMDKTVVMENKRRVFSLPVTWTLIGCVAMASWISQSLNKVLIGYFGATLSAGPGHDHAVVSTLFSVAAIAGLLGVIVGVLITEKPLKGNARPVVLAGFIIPAIFLCLMGLSSLTTSQILLELSIFAVGFFLAFVRPQVLGYIAKNYPGHITGTLGGLAMGIGGFMGLIGARACTEAQRLSGYQLSLDIMVGIAVLGVLFAVFLKPVNGILLDK